MSPWRAGFAQRLCRVAAGFSLRDLGARAGYNHETLRRYLYTGNTPAEFVVHFAEALGVRPEWLLTGRGPSRRRGPR